MATGLIRAVPEWLRVRLAEALADASEQLGLSEAALLIESDFNDGVWGCPKVNRYRAGDKFTRHTDVPPGFMDRAWLTGTLQLSDARDYAGGHMGVEGLHGPVPVSRTRGSLTIFSAQALHWMSPVTSGERRSFVFWASSPGPNRRA